MTGRFIYHAESSTFSIEGRFIAFELRGEEEESPDFEDDPIPEEWRNHIRDIMR